MFKLEFETDNASFDFNEGKDEVMFILETISNKVSSGYTSGIVLDSNGNSIGNWSLDI